MAATSPEVIAEARRTFEVASQCPMLSVLDLKPASAKARVGLTTNPIIWAVGHLAGHQDVAIVGINGRKPILPEMIMRCFSWGTDPSKDLADYPAFAEVMDAYIEVTAASKRALADAAPEEWSAVCVDARGERFRSGETLLETVRRVSLHHMHHVGCITAIRKELGDKCPRGFVPGMSDEALAKQQAQFDAFWQAHRGDYA